MELFDMSHRTIGELLNDIDNGKIMLPKFQRQFKWKPSQIKKLLDSIQKMYPAGSLLFLQVDRDRKLIKEEKFFGTDDEMVNYKETEYLVLDGQQRLTSCYCVFYNKGKFSYYLDLKKLYELYRKTGNLDNIEFDDYIENKKLNNSPLPQLSQNGLLSFSYLRDRENDLIPTLKTYKDDLRKDSNNKDYIDFLDVSFEQCIKGIFKYRFPIIILPKNLSLDAVCKVFQTINTTGLKLSPFDICVAKFMIDDIDLKDKVDNVLEDYSAIETIFNEESLDGTTILQIIALLVGVPSNQNKLANNLKKEHIITWWDKAVKGLDNTLQILDNSVGAGTQKSLKLLPYTPMIPVIASALVKCNFEKMNQGEQSSIIQIITKYYYFSAFSMRFTEGASTKTIEDAKMLADWFITGLEPTEVLRGIDWNTETLKFTKLGHAFACGFLTAINKNSPNDFYKNERVGVGVSIAESQLHHLFPKKEYSVKLDKKQINSIFNQTFLTSETNNYIKSDSTQRYLDKIITQTGKTEKSLRSIMLKHMINEDAFKACKEERFEDFLSCRISMLRAFLVDEIGLVVNEVQQSEMEELIEKESD